MESLSLFVFGWLSTFGIALVVFVGTVSILFEIFEIIFLLTPSTKDDLWLAALRQKWQTVKPILQWFHIKTPITKILDKVFTIVRFLKKLVLQYKNHKRTVNVKEDRQDNDKGH